MFLDNMPIRRKLMMVLLLTSGSVLLLTWVSFITYEVVTLHRGMVDSLTTRSRIIASNVTAALAFQNESDATQVLASLKTDRRILAACVYDLKGRIFARYPGDKPAADFPDSSGTTGYRNGYLEVFAPVTEGDHPYGTIFLRSNLSALTDRYWAYAWLSASVIAGSLLLGYLLAVALQAQISGPILALSEVARKITRDQDFSLRIPKGGRDEMGTLQDSFNRMLEEVQTQQRIVLERTRLLDLVMRNMSEGIVVADQEGRMTYFNQAAERIVGKGISSQGPSQWTKEYGVFREDKVTPYPEQESPLVLAVQGKEANGVIQFLRNAGNPEGVFISVNARPLKDEDGKVNGGLVVLHDLTAALKAEADLRASEANYREIFEKISDTLYVHDLKTGRILDVNNRVTELIGYTRNEVLGSDPALFTTGNPGYTLADAAAWMKRAQDEGPQIFEWQARHKNGEVRWVEVHLRRTVIGGQDRLLAMVRDISERRRLQETLKAQDFVSSILENVPNMIFVKEAKDLRFVMFNKAGEELLGLSRAELIGKNDHDLFPAEQAEFFISKDRAVLNGGKLLDIPEESIDTKENGRRTLHTRKIPVMGKDGKPLYLLGISEDVTDQKERERLRVYTAALEVSNKELQDFVFVASHDLQEPLRKVQSFGEFLRDEFQEVLGETGRGYVDRMQNAAGRMQRLINDLLALTRVTTKAKPFLPVDMGPVLKDVLSDLEVRIGERKAKVEVGEMPRIEADATQMRQLFQNLIGNALKFQRPGVEPEVKVGAQIAGNGKTCRFTVEDNGIGFDNKYADQIFKVFERLHGKDEYEGTGIGLAVCRKVVERHGGSIRAEGKPGQGACFIVELPVHHKA
ncbi:MAG TPA: PAS domain S-box protein [bacterium]|nr:PAS domain S-box protein [bacterium]